VATNRIPVRILTYTPQGTTNPAAPTSRSIAPPSVRSLAPAQPRMQLPTFAGNRVQSAQRQAFRRAAAQVDSDNAVTPGVVFTGGTQLAVPHSLGRAWVGCRLETPIGGYLSYQVAHNSDPRADASYILVTVANSCTADVVVW
jgi:hypothetical protein